MIFYWLRLNRDAVEDSMSGDCARVYGCILTRDCFAANHDVFIVEFDRFYIRIYVDLDGELVGQTRRELTEDVIYLISAEQDGCHNVPISVRNGDTFKQYQMVFGQLPNAAGY